MDAKFILVHDLSLEARIKFCSNSVVDILGYYPSEVRGKSCWEYFHPDEIPLARSVHNQSLHLDKAAVWNYCQIRHKNGNWVCCECVFTVVYDVLISSVSEYKGGPKAKRRALDGALIKRIFSSPSPPYPLPLSSSSTCSSSPSTCSSPSPQGTCSVLPSRLYQEPKAPWREPRAALFLNRFTRSSTIMFATKGVSTILGVSAEQLTGKSFYFCISESSLADAVKCVESAKSDDSIVYLRFRYRDPTLPDNLALSIPTDDELGDEDDHAGYGSVIGGGTCHGPSAAIPYSYSDCPPSLSHVFHSLPALNCRARRDAASNSTYSPPPVKTATEQCRRYSSESNTENAAQAAGDTALKDTPIEIEAVISCSSDSLVVIIRRAHPLVPKCEPATCRHHKREEE